MSKACASREEAEATVADYAGKGQPAHIEEVEGKFLVKRTADNKVQPLRTATTPAAPARAQHGHLTCISPASHLHPTNAPPTTGAQERQVFAGRARAHTRRTVQLTIGRLDRRRERDSARSALQTAYVPTNGPCLLHPQEGIRAYVNNTGCSVLSYISRSER